MTWEEIENKDGFYITVNLTGVLAQTSGYYGAFFTARHPFEVLRASEVHTVAGSDAGAVSVDIEKVEGTTAIGSGTSVLASTFDLKSTANTVVYKEAYNLSSARILKEGDRLALKVSGTLTDLQGVQITLYCKMSGRGHYR